MITDVFVPPVTVALLDDKWGVVQLPELSLDNASSLFTDRGVYILVGIESKPRNICES